MAKAFPSYKQLEQMDCGPTCLRIIAKHYGKSYSLDYIRSRSYITKTGSSLLGLSEAAQAIGLRSLAVRINFNRLNDEAPLPCIAHWKGRHFVVVYKVTDDKVFISDPAHGLIEYDKQDFISSWIKSGATDTDGGVIMLLEKAAEFHTLDIDEDEDKASFAYVYRYIKPYYKFIVQLFLGMLVGSVLMLIFPFLTQAIVDRGIEYRDTRFIYMILAGQLMLFAGQISVQFIQSWILLHVSTRINISMISDFLAKLMRLPISYFDSRQVGDILQRIGDHERIQDFLTIDTLQVLFAALNFIVFAGIMIVFDVNIFLVFIISTVLYILWIVIFLKKREELDYRSFDQMSKNQSNIVQLVTAMPDIKLNNAEHQKRWEWERIQAKLFRIKIDQLKLSQYQEVGTFSIRNLKDIIITFLSAKAVIDGNMTLGSMMAIQYIVGQANSPLENLVDFITKAQDARISIDRLKTIQDKEDEEPIGVNKLTTLEGDVTIAMKDLNFRYGAPSTPLVLENINVEFPEGKTTAIVGASGSGKTTLLKLLLMALEPVSGKIMLGRNNLDNFHSGWWRSSCGTVMQDGFIYSDSIMNNIGIGVESIDQSRLMQAIKIANIGDLIENLPQGIHTEIGMEGSGISEGQKQRILIARAVYKDPKFLFFDEATSALDANNEKVIMNNLSQFFKNRTVVIIAHRLSTVKDADNIIVLDRGKVVEQGSHEQLTKSRGYYFRLVQNQLELGN